MTTTKNISLPVAGYSGTPLIKKLGIKDNFKIRLMGEPGYYIKMLDELPGVKIQKTKFHDLDFIHLFEKDEAKLKQQIPILKKQLKQNGMIWISWPKKSSKLITTLTDLVVRNTAIANGLVDIKVCAVDEVWSGLKFVIPVNKRSLKKKINS